MLMVGGSVVLSGHSGRIRAEKKIFTALEFVNGYILLIAIGLLGH